jgi:ankyrin repeat protein
MASRLVKSTVVLALALAPWACTSTQDKARASLGAMNITYGDDSFVDRAGAGDALAVRAFLQSGMKPDATDKDGRSALTAAADEGRLDVVKLLLAAGARVDGTDRKFKRTPLVWAASRGHGEVVAFLLSKGADKDARDEKAGMSALIAASFRGHGDTVKLLLDKGVKVDDPDRESRTALMWASQSGRADIVKMLMDHGADHKRRENTHGANALIVAAARGRTPIVQLLLDTGANPEDIDKERRTPLMWAAKNGHAETVRLLLDRGVNSGAKDITGKTAADLAKESQKPTVEELLKEGAQLP